MDVVSSSLRTRGRYHAPVKSDTKIKIGVDCRDNVKEIYREKSVRHKDEDS